MKGSILIIGNNINEAKQRVLSLLADWKTPISKNNPDLIFIEVIDDKKSIGIGQIKELKSYLMQKPFQNKFKTTVIEKAGLLTTEAQNALLKTLEEPPAYANLILCIEKEGDLLPTILSRCQKIYVTNAMHNEKGAGQGSLNLESSLGDKLVKAEELGKMERDEAIDVLKGWAMNLHKKTDISEKENEALKLLLKVISDLENTNVSLKLAIEYLLLQI